MKFLDVFFMSVQVFCIHICSLFIKYLFHLFLDGFINKVVVFSFSLREFSFHDDK